MSFPIARPKSRGFTLIELLIVVIILAILAAIAIPQFSASTTDAQAAALDANLAAVRSSIEQYRIQHGNTFPGKNASTGGSCTATKGTGAAGSAQALLDQMRFASDAAGNTCSIADSTTYRFGPYLRQGIPNEPINNKGSAAADITMQSTGAQIAVAAGATGGWAYDTVTGQFIMNSSALDQSPTPRAYSTH